MKRDDLFKHIATLGPIGYLPVAPGTWASLAASIFFLFLKPTMVIHVISVFLIIPIGIAASSRAERAFGQKDSRQIVIDEACGVLVSLLFIPFSVPYVFAAFFLFRFFDILKPFPVRKAETAFSGGLGIMADDIVAGVYANIILQLWKLISYFFFP